MTTNTHMDLMVALDKVAMKAIHDYHIVDFTMYTRNSPDDPIEEAMAIASGFIEPFRKPNTDARIMSDAEAFRLAADVKVAIWETLYMHGHDIVELSDMVHIYNDLWMTFIRHHASDHGKERQ